MIYDHIKKVYNKEREGQISVSLHNSDSLRKMERPSTAQKHEKQDSSTSSNYYFRNNSNNSRNEKPKTTETKTSQHVGTPANKQTTNSSYF